MGSAILPDLWARLRRLQGCCGIEHARIGCERDGFGWRVVISRRDQPESFLVVETATLVEGLSSAVLMAERRGWHGWWPGAPVSDGRNGPPAAQTA